MVDGIGSSTNSVSAALQQMRQNIFNKTDTDGDGFLSKIEMSANAPKNGPSVDDIFGAFDTDGDELISQTEFETGLAMYGQQKQVGFSMKMGMMGGPPPAEEEESDEFSILDTNGDGVIDMEELAADLEEKGITADASQLFSQIDTDGDGQITSTEFNSSRPGPQGPPPPPSPPSADDLFSLFDSNGDEQISQEEFELGMAALDQQMQSAPMMGMMGGSPPAEESENDFFSSIDTDGNGSIDIEELTADIQSKGLGIDAEQLFSELDTDGDGQISRTESDSARQNRTDKTTETSSTNETTSTEIKNNFIRMILQSYLSFSSDNGDYSDILGSFYQSV